MTNANSQPDLPRWLQDLFEQVRQSWNYHGPCLHINFSARNRGGYWEVFAAPIFQEVYGGSDDGKKVWTGFVFEASDFLNVPDLSVENVTVASYCNQCSPFPTLTIKGQFQDHPVVVNVVLEPMVDSETVELLDTLSHEIRDVPQGEAG
jgi:hypothetical protein